MSLSLDTADILGELGVLVVEDSSEMRKIMQGMLSSIGVHQSFMAKDGMEALLFMGDCGDMIDIVLCDWNMPNMTGAELLGQIRSADPDIPFIMITGRADKGSILEARALGTTGYIAKPFSEEELAKKMTVVARMAAARNA